MAGVSHHSWDLETEVPTVLTRATVADGKYIQKDTIDPLINRDEALKSWLEDTGDELVRVSGELMDTISSVSSTLDTKIDTTSAALHNEITATSASLHEELTAASASLDAKIDTASSTLNTKIDTASGNIMSDMKTSADNLILYTNSASAYVQGNLQTSADTLVSALNDLDTEFATYLKTLCSAGEVGQVAVWENVSEGTYALSARPIVTSPDNTNGFVESSGIKSYVDTQINEHVAGLFSFKGSKSVDEINALNNMSAGDVYNLTTNGIISAGEFDNMSAQSGDNIVYVTNDGAPHWDKMAAAFNDENCMKLVSSATSGNIATFNSKGQVEDLGIDPVNFGKCEVIQIEGAVGNPSFWADDMTTTHYDKVINAAKDALRNGKSLIIDVGSDRDGSQCYYHRFALSESNINDGSSSGWFEFKYIGDSFEVGTSEADATDNSGFRIYYGSSYEDKCKLIESKYGIEMLSYGAGIYYPHEDQYWDRILEHAEEIVNAADRALSKNKLLMLKIGSSYTTGRGWSSLSFILGEFAMVEGKNTYSFYTDTKPLYDYNKNRYGAGFALSDVYGEYSITKLYVDNSVTKETYTYYSDVAPTTPTDDPNSVFGDDTETIAKEILAKVGTVDAYYFDWSMNGSNKQDYVFIGANKYDYKTSIRESYTLTDSAHKLQLIVAKDEKIPTGEEIYLARIVPMIEMNTATNSGIVDAGNSYTGRVGAAWTLNDGVYYDETAGWTTGGEKEGTPQWTRVAKIKKMSVFGGTESAPKDISNLCDARSFIYCLGPDSAHVNDKSYVKIVLSDALDDDVIQLHFPNNDGGTLTIENKYGETGYIKVRGTTTSIADNGTYTIDFPSNALVAVGRYNNTVMICEGGAGGAGGDVVTYYVNDGNQGPTFAEVNAALDAHKLVFIRSRNDTIFTYWGWHRYISNEGLSYVFCAPLLHTNGQSVSIPTLYVSRESEVHTRDDGTQYTNWHSMNNTLPVLHTFTTQTTASEVFQSGISSIPAGIYQFCDDGCIYEFSKYEYEDHPIITFTHTFEDGSVASWVGEEKRNAASESEMVWTKHADSALPFTVIYGKTPMKDMVDAYKAGRPFVFKLSEVTLLATPCLSYAVTENSFNCIVGNSSPVFGWNPGETVYPEMYYHYSYNTRNGEWHSEQQKVENIIRTDSSYVSKGPKYAATGQAGLGSFLFSVGSESENTIDQTIFINSNNTDSSVRYTYDYAEVSLNGILEITIKTSSNGEFPIVIDYQKAKSNGSSTPPFVLLSDNSPRYTLHNGTNIIPFNWTYKIRYSEIASDDYAKLFKTPTNYYPSKLWIGFDTSDKTPEKVEGLEPVDSYSYVKTQVYNMHTKVYLHNVTSVRTIS